MSIIYVLTNPAFAGYVKIGKTGNLAQRLRGLDNTSVPLPFRCEYAVRVDDMNKVESLLHDAFGDRRVRERREFFEVDASRVIAAMKLTGGEDVTPNRDIAADEDGLKAINNRKPVKKPVNFEMIGIKPGTELSFVNDKTITAIVKDKWRIVFEGEDIYMSPSALRILHSQGKTWKTVNGADYWAYDGETINERRKRLEREEDERDED